MLKNVTPGRALALAGSVMGAAGLPALAHAQSNTVDLSPMQTSMTSMITLGTPVAVAIAAAVFGFAALIWIMKKVQSAK